MAAPLDSDPPVSLRKAKALAHDFKKALRSSNPWDRPIESQRQQLRRLYVRLAADDATADIAQQLLWSDTSHAVIDVYRVNIQNIEKAVVSAKAEGPTAKRSSSHGPVELRKVSQSFRAFLSEEEKFWRQFCLRLAHGFDRSDVMDVLLRVGISDDSIPGQDDDGDRLPAAATPLSDELREKKIDMLQRSIVYLGDLARYRELTDATYVAKPKARGKGRETEVPRPTASRTFTKSEGYYQAARTLAPENGTPFNQLAILAMYQTHHFDALYFYLRAACTNHPFATVSENIDRLLSKVLQESRRSNSNAKPQTPPSEDHAARLDLFEHDVLLLHALWGKNSGSTLEKQSANVENVFPDLVKDRVLSTEVISRTFLMACAAFWRSGPNSTKAVQAAVEKDGVAENSPEINAHIFGHLLRCTMALLQVGQAELTHQMDAPESTATNLSLRVSAVLRRSLVTLRLASRWVRLNLDRFVRPAAECSDDLVRFWPAYASFLNRTASIFPLAHLPSALGPLEEDFSVRGFLPLEEPSAVTLQLQRPLAHSSANQAHPNEEQLMRIADILRDAQHICAQKPSPLVLHNGAYRLRSEALHRSAPSTLMASEGIPSTSLRGYDGQKDMEDDAAINSSTDDDPVDLAMRIALEHVEGMSTTDEEDEQILFPPPRPATHVNVQPDLFGSNEISDGDIFHHNELTTKIAPATAQDLLLQALDPLRAPLSSHTLSPKSRPLSDYIQPPILFGPTSSGVSSIWSGHALSDRLRTPSNGRNIATRP